MGGRREEGAQTKRREEMKIRYFLFSLFIFPLLIGGCGQWGGWLPEGVVAQVNEDQITSNEFEREFKELIFETGKESSKTEIRDLKQACLDQMVERKVLVQEARKLGIKISQEEVSQAISEIKKDYPGEGFGEKLNLKGVSLEEWKTRLEEKLLAEKMIRSALHSSKGVNEKELLQYYETHRSSFELGPKVKARQIVVADGEEAIQILKRLKKGEKFEKMAAEKSLGPEKIKGGDLGTFSQGEKPAEFDSVFEMKVGDVSEVIKSPYGYHIFKLEEKTEARRISFEEARSGILQELIQKKGEEDYQKWLSGLKKKAKIKVKQKWLNS
jgi:peptidyl-prolyl cis-trans isomerase C